MVPASSRAQPSLHVQQQLVHVMAKDEILDAFIGETVIAAQR